MNGTGTVVMVAGWPLTRAVDRNGLAIFNLCGDCVSKIEGLPATAHWGVRLHLLAGISVPRRVKTRRMIIFACNPREEWPQEELTVFLQISAGSCVREGWLMWKLVQVDVYEDWWLFSICLLDPWTSQELRDLYDDSPSSTTNNCVAQLQSEGKPYYRSM